MAEYKQLTLNPPEGIIAGPADEENFFDFRRDGEGFDEGFQSVPANWRISSERKKGFFEKVKEITGY